MSLSSIGDLPLFKRRGPNVEELETLLDLLPDPTIIANDQTGRLLFANAKVTQLTAYTRRELSELEVNTLLPGFSFDGKNNLESQTLVTRSSRVSQVKPVLAKLGGPDHWIAISFLDPTAHQDDSDQANQPRWEALPTLILALQQHDLTVSFRQILRSGNLLTGASHLALYLPHENRLSLESVFGENFDFPNTLALADLEYLNTAKLWRLGIPIETSLHRLANSRKLSYLATAPLETTKPELGLLVIAEDKQQALREILSLSQVLASITSTAIAHSEVVEALLSKLENLQQANQIRSALQDNIQDGVIFIDQTEKIIDINLAAESMLGYSLTEAKDRNLNEILISNPSILGEIEEGIQNSKTIDLGQRKVYRRDGRELLTSILAVPIRKSNDPDKVAILISDLSEHEAFHAQSQQLQQRAAIGEITAIFAHEVRNPINSISTGLQLMQMSIPEQDPMQEQINKLQEDVDRLEHRMKSLDAFSRNLEPRPEPLDLGEFSRSQLERWRPRMARKGISDHIQTAPNTPFVLADRKALDQVLTNLITNAIQAMEDQGEGVIALRVRPSQENQGMVEWQISDSGPGIPEEIRRRIFEPFFSTKGEGGTGLGLAITRRIILAHQGKIECESFPGGTLFKIQLPVAPNKEGTTS